MKKIYLFNWIDDRAGSIYLTTVICLICGCFLVWYYPRYPSQVVKLNQANQNQPWRPVLTPDPPQLQWS